jgi:hypothetical protein
MKNTLRTLGVKFHVTKSPFLEQSSPFLPHLASNPWRALFPMIPELLRLLLRLLAKQYGHNPEDFLTSSL